MIFKLYGINGNEVKSFFNNAKIPFTLDNTCNDYLLNIDFSKFPVCPTMSGFA